MDILQMNWGSIVRKSLILTCLIVASIGFGGAVYGQTPSASPATSAVSGVIGEVKAIDAAAKQIVVRDDKGVIFTVNLSDKTQYKRMAPGERTMTSAADITLADVGQGDRVWARWRAGSDQKTVPSAQVVVMSKADVAKKQEQERAEWRKRGISGIVTSVNPSTKEITVSSRSLMGTPQAVIIPITEKVLIRRYAPDTIPKYSEAKPSTFEEVKVEDQLRALGDKSADGTRLTAEEVVFGTFKVVGGTVTAIDAATNQIKINDLKTKKPITIVLKSDSVLRRWPENMTAMFGGGMGPGAGGPARTGAGPGPGQATQRPQGAGPGGPQGGGMRGGGMNVADVLERLPTISINEVKVGDMIIMSSLPGSDPTQFTAISLVTGVEPLLTMVAARQQTGGAQGRAQGVDLNGSFGGMFGGVGVP
jgi:co-chaperonin GroES (HSP10)